MCAASVTADCARAGVRAQAGLDEAGRLRHARAVWIWVLAAAVVIAIVVTWRVATWRYSSALSEPCDETLSAQLLAQMNRLTSDQYRWVCGQLAEGARVEQEVLRKALSELPGYHAQG